MDQNSVELYYIDYGNHDVASMERVKKIDRRFVAQLEAQAIYCSTPTVKPLSETDWAGAAVERFTGLVLEKQLVGKVLRKGLWFSLTTCKFSFFCLTLPVEFIPVLVYLR